MNAWNRFNKAHSDAVKLIPGGSGFAADTMQAHRCRLAVIYGVAAMDAYFTARFIELLDGYIARKGVSKGLTKILREAGVDVRFFLDILTGVPLGPGEQTRLTQKIRTRIKLHLATFTCHSPSRINHLFIACDLPNLCELAMQRARTDGLLTGIRTPLARLKRLVERRHKIVHANDFNARGHYSGITAETTGQELKLIHGFVTGAERIINHRFKTIPPNADKAT